MPRTLPSELVDAIIDAIALQDRPSLGSCARVSSSWLPRSRYHLFTSLNLSPPRVITLATLLEGSQTTLPKFIRHIELDGNLRPPKCRRGNDDALLEQMTFFATVHRDTQSLMNALVALTGASAHLQLASLTLRNIDFTLIPPKQFVQIQQQLVSSTFVRSLQHLALADVSFQSFKQPHTLIQLFPKLEEVSFGKQITFLRLQDTTCDEAASLPWKAGVKVIHIEAEEEQNILEMVLSWVASGSESLDTDPRSLQKLTINGFQEKAVDVLQRAIERVAPCLQKVELLASHTISPDIRDAVSQSASSSTGCQFYFARMAPPSTANAESQA